MVGTNDGANGRRELIAGNNSGEVKEGVEAGEFRWAFRDNHGAKSAVTQEINGVRKGARGSAFVEFAERFLGFVRFPQRGYLC